MALSFFELNKDRYGSSVTVWQQTKTKKGHKDLVLQLKTPHYPILHYADLKSIDSSFPRTSNSLQPTDTQPIVNIGQIR